jgi:hypothetical protein
MNLAKDISWLAGQWTFLWPVPLCFGILFGSGVFWDFARARLKLERRLFYLVLPVLGLALILAVGSVFARRPELVYLAHLAFGLAIALAGSMVVLLKPAWVASVAALLFTLWCSVWCWVVSVMSITGESL